MAITTVDPIIADMVLVTKWDRLGARDSYFRDIGGPIEFRQHQRERDDKGEPAENADFGDGVRARMKNLRHRPEPVGP